MPTAAINKKAHRILTQIFAWLVFSCILFNALPLFAYQNPKDSELIFCPLQKTWVPKYAPQPAFKEPLSDICASDSQKSGFLLEASKKMPLLRYIHDEREVENLFFNYLEKGKRAFAEISSPQNLPEGELAKSAGEQKTAASLYKTDFEKTGVEIFTLQQAARPPTVHQIASFETAAAIKLETISRRIQPRAPPVLYL